jgi:hypothetical protein
LGILRIVEEIMERRPNAHIVINSLLPITTLRGDFYPVISDMEDSFVDKADLSKIQVDSAEEAKDEETMNRRLVENKNSASTKEILISEKEEALRDKRKRNNRQPKKAPVLKEGNRIKKFKVGHIRKNKLPLWSSVKAINNALEKFAKNHPEKISFFNATDIFIENKGKEVVLRTAHTSSKGHPTIAGFMALEDKIASFLDALLTNMHFDEKHISYDAYFHGDDEFQSTPLGVDGEGDDEDQNIVATGDDDFQSYSDDNSWLDAGNGVDDTSREVYIMEDFDDDGGFSGSDDMST